MNERLFPKDEYRWICREPLLQKLMDRYPQDWQYVGPELLNALEAGSGRELTDFCAQKKLALETWQHRVEKSRHNPKVIESAIPQLIRNRMFLLAVDLCYQTAALGATGKIRLNRVNGYIIQKLLFERHLTRKPASLKSFKFWWRLVTQKRILMSLVQTKGIYCFYSRELIRELCRVIGNRTCLEIGAGDGTLTRFLANQGVSVRATDDHSWQHRIEYPEAVEKLGAKQALAKYEPQAVICSWPPPGNAFERIVLNARSVETYVVIGSRYKFASGNWTSYEEQHRFEWAMDRKLSSMVIPPELESAVMIFQRKVAQSPEPI
jgi:hypothetical protein